MTLLLAVLTMSVQTAKAQSLYAKISNTDNTTMTLICATSAPTEEGYTFYEYNNLNWNSSFRGTITSATIDASCSAYSGTTLKRLFYYCQKLVTITGLTNLNTANVENMESMFSECYALTSLDLSSFNTEKVTDMSGMFAFCYKLTSPNLSSFNTAAVTTMNSMFNYCSDLISLNLSNFNTAAVTNMGYMFAHCEKLETLDLTNFNTAAVTDMGSMFYNCSNLETIMVGEGWNTANVSSSDYMFTGCTKLVGGNGTAYNSSYIDKTYAPVDYPDDSNPGYLTELRLCATMSGTAMTVSYAQAPTVAARYTVGTGFGNAFKTATSITLDATCANFVTTSLACLFKGFSAATSITGLENLNTANVTDMDDVFRDCAAVTLLDLRTWDTDNVVDYGMEAMFWNCTNLKTIIVADDWQATTGSAMLAGCSSLIGDAGNLCTLTNYWYQDYGYAHAGDGGYLTGATRTLTANGPVDGKYYTTFFNSAVGYTITGGTAYAGVYDSGSQKITLTSLGTDIPANTPVIIRADAASVTMTVDNTLAAYAGTNNLHGVDIQTNTTDIKTALGDGTFYVLGNKNSNFGFHQYTGATMPARKAFLLLNGAVALSINFDIDDETTGLKSIDNGQLTIDNYYDLSGRRVMNPTKGLYIVNGKKVIIK